MVLPTVPTALSLAVVTTMLAITPAAADPAAVIAATYPVYSLSPPTAASIVVCHGYGCRLRNEIGITAADRRHLGALMAAGRASAAAERHAVGRAGAWFDRRIGPAAGTVDHVARAGVSYVMRSDHQFDCIDSSRNATTLLLLLDELRLLHFHEPDDPVARGYLIDGRPPHVTAVLRDKTTGHRWAVDPWTRGYGQPPEIMPLDRWMPLY
jgi:hypothetical protein